LVITTGPAVGAPLGATDVVGLALAITVGLAVGTALAITVGLAVGAGVTGAIVGAGVTGAAVAMVGGGVGGRVGGGVGGRVGAGVTGATVGAAVNGAGVTVGGGVGGRVGGRVGGSVGGGVLLFEITNRRQNKSSDGIRQHRRLKRHKVSIPNNSSSYCFSRQHFNSPGWSYCWRSSRFRCCWRQRNRPMG
jgi:hypothetical protein